MFQPSINRRSSLRLKGYDYAQAALYFVTICTRNRECLLGDIRKAKVVLSPVGKMVLESWYETGHRFGGLRLDAFVVMPNHFHGIIGLSGSGYERRRQREGKLSGGASPAPTTSPATLSRVIGAFKSISTLRAHSLQRGPGRPLWQRGFYEHVVRNAKDLDDIREYISLNPARWEQDPDHL